MAFALKLGPSGWDAIKYVRGRIEDPSGPNQMISDDVFQMYAEDVLEEFSERVYGEAVVGTPWSTPPASPFVTIRQQQRYILQPGTLGLPTTPIIGVTDLLWVADSTISAINDFSYLQLLPSSALARFIPTGDILDQPSYRIMREMRLDELRQYGKGYYSVSIDPATGFYAVDLAPVPLSAGIPVYIKVATSHSMDRTDPANWLIPTIPENRKRHFARLLHATMMEQEAERVAKVKLSRGGLIEETSDANATRRQGEAERAWVLLELGDGASVGRRT